MSNWDVFCDEGNGGMLMTRTFVATGHYDGWKFTLEPMTAGEFGAPGYTTDSTAPGYRLVQLEPSKVDVASLRLTAGNGRPLSDEEIECRRKRVYTRDPEWREEQWLTEWLKRGLIKEVASG